MTPTSIDLHHNIDALSPANAGRWAGVHGATDRRVRCCAAGRSVPLTWSGDGSSQAERAWGRAEPADALCMAAWTGDLAACTRLLGAGTHPVGYKVRDDAHSCRLLQPPPLSRWQAFQSDRMREWCQHILRVFGPGPAGRGRLDGPALRRIRRQARGGPAAPRVRGGRPREGDYGQWLPSTASSPLELAGVSIGLGERVVPAG